MRSRASIYRTLSLTGLYLGLISTSTHASRSLPPAHLYHFGSAPILAQNIEARTVPPAAWDRFIMGEETQFGLQPFRRGLYGSEHPGYADYYGDLMLTQAQLPSFMIIELADYCRDAARIAWIHALPEDPRFETWLSLQANILFRSVLEFTEQCYRPGVYRDRARTIRRFVGRDIYGARTPETPCEAIVNNFLNEYKITTVFDEAWPASWYIRDRACISDIRGSLADIWYVMATLPGYWNNKLPDGSTRTSGNPERGAATLTILIRALAESPSVDTARLDVIRQALVLSDIWLFKEYGTLLVDAYVRSQIAGRFAEFQWAAQEYLQAIERGQLKVQDDFWTLIWVLKQNLTP